MLVSFFSNFCVLVFLLLLDEYAVHGIEGPISGIPLTSDSGKKKILLLKGKQREIPNVGLVLPIKLSFLFINTLFISILHAFINHINISYFLIFKIKIMFFI